MKSSLVFFIVITAIFFDARAQTEEVTGTIYAFNKFPLKNVSVTARKSKQQVKTDENGTFRIQVKEKDQLNFEADAFEKFIYRLGKDQKSIRANMIYIDRKKNFDVALNGGYISREHLEYGLKNLANENNVYSSFTNVFDAVIYAVPTGRVINENGTQKIQLRGVKSSSGSNAALIVVNGFLRDDISYIIPSDIVSIKQLPPSAAAVYGTGSGNGVIAIKTK
jgi:hypothetical protein